VLGESLHNSYGVDVQWLRCDLADEDDREAFLAQVAASKIRFAGLINVAGGDVEGLFLEQRTESMRLILRLNVEAALELTHGVLALRDGLSPFHVINVASLAAFYPMPYKATYAASKRFLLDFSLALREELRGQGVTVTALCPAGLPTTPECIAAIEAQGLMGQLTTLNTGSVAAGALDAALRGRAIYIPGGLNRLLRALGSLAPAPLVARFIGQRWAAAHRMREAAQRAKQEAAIAPA
jgi:short-subunit dehydrogenase